MFYVLYVFVVSAPFFGLHLPFLLLSFLMHVVCYTHDCSYTHRPLYIYQLYNYSAVLALCVHGVSVKCN